MKTVTEKQLQRDLDKVEDMAMREPLVVTHKGRERMVLMSLDEYRRLQVTHRKSNAIEDLPEWIVEAVASAEMDPRFAHLDQLLD